MERVESFSVFFALTLPDRGRLQRLFREPALQSQIWVQIVTLFLVYCVTLTSSFILSLFTIYNTTLLIPSSQNCEN